MFIVKAEVEPTDGSGVRNATLYQAHRVRIAKRSSSTQGAHDFEVELMDQSNHIHDTLLIGHGIEYFNAAFIMNESGKTVDRVVPALASRPLTS
jgi:hypothetical protein